MFDDLNSEQQSAVHHDGTPLLIVAGAGTGKTKTLVSRVVRLIEDGADPSRILLLTFTRRAAAEMLGRVTSASTNRAAGQVWGGTFHATANRLLRSVGESAGLSPNFTVLDQGDSVDLFGMVRNEEGFGERGKRFPRKETIGNVYSRMVNSQAKLDDVLETDYPWVADHADDLRTIFTAYTSRKRQHQVLDYDDLLLFWRGITAGTGGSALRTMFDHILIDEYQDTNPIQVDIISGMVGPSTQVCAVGDDAQAIYGFRSATVENMWRFGERFAGATTITLEQNYRSTMPVLAVANAVLDQESGGATDAEHHHFRKSLWSTRTAGPQPNLAIHHDEGDQSRQVAQDILDARERGIDLREQAVLFRTGHHADHLELELTRRDIPYVKYGGLKYLEAAHVKDLLSLLRVLENPSDQLAWHRVFDTIEGVGPATTRRLSEELAIADPGVDSLDRLLSDEIRFPSAALEHAAELRASFADCRNEATPASQINRLHQYCAAVFPSRYENAGARLADIDQLAATATQYPTRSRMLTELTLDPPGKTGDLAGPPHKDDDWLTLSTIHSAKGCEWRSVHVLHAADGNIPSDMAIGDKAGLAEELRLLYVALTRAKDELSVHVPLRYHVNRHGGDDRHLYAQMSRFIEPVRHLFDESSPATNDDIVELDVIDGVGVADEVDSMLTALWS
jgi:DNA helicase-2/ATP-dependent DNA helicase PcrA